MISTRVSLMRSAVESGYVRTSKPTFGTQTSNSKYGVPCPQTGTGDIEVRTPIKACSATSALRGDLGAGRCAEPLFQVPLNPGELRDESLLPSSLYLPGAMDFPEGSLALPWRGQSCSSA